MARSAMRKPCRRCAIQLPAIFVRRVVADYRMESRSALFVRDLFWRLQIPAVGTRPALGGKLTFEIDLTFAQIGGVLEVFSPFRTVRVDDAQNVAAVRRVVDFV